ncbi:MAG: hypothetical protein HY000_24625 [Planctomycetes bacterium]|nr:hypothetical protein [Planctomycetota bacterium]
MNPSQALETFLSVVANQPLLARLFFASLEFAAFALILSLALRLGRWRSPRLASLLWLLVLAKPTLSLLLGSPLPISLLQAPLPGWRSRRVRRSLRPQSSAMLLSWKASSR